MATFGLNRPPLPPPHLGKFEWGGPHPDGYQWPPGYMQPGAFLVCERCGGAVSPSAPELHDEWHARLGS